MWAGHRVDDLAVGAEAASMRETQRAPLERRAEASNFHVANGQFARRAAPVRVEIPRLASSVVSADAAFEAVWPETSRRLRTLLEAGARVLVHCKGGLGRAGTVAARLLVEMGADPKQAIRDVRTARSPDAIENRAQEDWVRRGRVAAGVS